ncbi:hypothetical protein [cf. Phormidesmis sp. LEGE 11477]|uniref:hypothetical protein n=1 Tax=cf. Phormidesmis sp. LEGE 11477 TaxID=1828680 RepID=UPI00187EEC10|nr:hypothetical protein [cf. Phormidesmis sp. LEGE 11477]MBE9063874.1 hypothetical protein [cf. Phormidesmis sp. LEGE 11477]
MHEDSESVWHKRQFGDRDLLPFVLTNGCYQLVIVNTEDGGYLIIQADGQTTQLGYIGFGLTIFTNVSASFRASVEFD